MAQHTVRPIVYYLVFAALLSLTGMTVAAARLPLGAWHAPTALGIAGVKAGLVILIFMHVYYSTRLTWVVALSGLAWLAILVGMTLNDYLMRDVSSSGGQGIEAPEPRQAIEERR